MKTKKNILIVDENSKRRQNISSRFRLGAYDKFETEMATGGFHALHLLEKHKYDLVIILDDFNDMPSMEIIQLIKNNHKVPILYMNAKEDLLAFKEMFTAGAKACEVYPNNFSDMLTAVNKILKLS